MFTLLMTSFCTFILFLYWRYLDQYSYGSKENDKNFLIVSLAAVVFVLLAYLLENVAVYFNGSPFPKEPQAKEATNIIEETSWTVGESNS